ncbi:MAG: hypothetical protein MJ238_01560 [Bacilli bacterium]|nr:hypothetical protein [Bacilli bacterium]
MSFNKSSIKKNAWQLNGKFKRHGYDWWWHNFTAIDDITGEEVPFFIEFFTINPGNRKGEKVLGQSKEAKEKGLKPSYVMVKCGCWGKNKKQLHRFYAWKDVTIYSGAPYFLDCKDCFASETKLKGVVKVSEEEAKEHPELMSDAGEIEFDLNIAKDIRYNVGYGTSWLFRFLKAFEMYWHVEGLRSYFEGKIIMDGRKYTVYSKASYGYSDKNWGSNFTSPWVWLSSSSVYSYKQGKKLDNTAFEIGGGKPKVFGITLERKLLGCLYLEGKEYEFNFSKFWTGSKTEFSYDETDSEILWHVKQENNKHILETEVSCKKEDMLFVNYEDPDGKKKFNHLWNGGNGIGRVKLYKKSKKGNELIDDLAFTRIGCEYGEFDE